MGCGWGWGGGVTLTEPNGWLGSSCDVPEEMTGILVRLRRAASVRFHRGGGGRALRDLFAATSHGPGGKLCAWWSARMRYVCNRHSGIVDMRVVMETHV